jgi:hypothetical protein
LKLKIKTGTNDWYRTTNSQNSTASLKNKRFNYQRTMADFPILQVIQGSAAVAENGKMAQGAS